MWQTRAELQAQAVCVCMQLSSQRVLTMEWVEGCRVDDQQAMQRLSLRPKDVAVLLLDAFAEMTYVHGFVHADPHPGNVLVRPAPQQGKSLLTPPRLPSKRTASAVKPTKVCMAQGASGGLPSCNILADSCCVDETDTELHSAVASWPILTC